MTKAHLTYGMARDILSRLVSNPSLPDTRLKVALTTTIPDYEMIDSYSQLTSEIPGDQSNNQVLELLSTTLLGDNLRGCRISPNGRYIALTLLGDTGVKVYKVESDSFTELAIHDPSDNAIEQDASFSPDSTLLAVAGQTSPYLTIYEIENDTFTPLPPLDPLPDCGTLCTFSPDGNYLAVAHDGLPGVTVYKISGHTLNRLSDLAYDPAIEEDCYGLCCAFSPDSAYLAVSYGGEEAPYLKVFKRSGDSFTMIPGVPDGTCYGYSCAFSPDGKYLAYGQDCFNEDYSTFVCKIEDNHITLLQTLDLQANEEATVFINFSPDSNYLIKNGPESILVYKLVEGLFTPYQSLTVSGMALGGGFSSDGTRFIACTQDSLHYYICTLSGPEGDTGYETGGKLVQINEPVQEGSNLTIPANNTIWANSSIDAVAAVIYDDTPADPLDKKILAVIDFEGTISSNTGSFTLAWGQSGILRMSLV